MACQSRMITDMFVADKVGVCATYVDSCCPFVPNSTAPDGPVTRALEGLKRLREELTGNSGVDTGCFDSMFGQWKTVIYRHLAPLSVLLSEHYQFNFL